LRYLVALMFLLGCGEEGLRSTPCEPYEFDGGTYPRAILEGLDPTEISDVKLCGVRSADVYEYSCFTDLVLISDGDSTEIICFGRSYPLLEYTDLTVYYRESK